jgi:hypothetical protein
LALVQVEHLENHRVHAAKVVKNGDSITGTEAALLKRESPAYIMTPRIRCKGFAHCTRFESNAIYSSKGRHIIEAQTMCKKIIESGAIQRWSRMEEGSFQPFFGGIVVWILPFVSVIVSKRTRVDGVVAIS